MVYETDAFHDLCDELGILVWQDFMLPTWTTRRPTRRCARGDDRVRQLLRRLQGRRRLPSSVAIAKSSSKPPCLTARRAVEESALPRAAPRAREVARAGRGWLRSTRQVERLPFHPDRGVTHYYGVGAYLRQFDDARRAGVGSQPSAWGSRTSPMPRW